MWAQAIAALLGAWITAAPDVLGYEGPLRTSDHVVGPTIASFGCVAVWGVTRSLRWVNLPLGLWVVAAAFVLGDGNALVVANDAAAGLLVAGLSTRRGSLRHPIGGGWRTALPARGAP